MLSLFRRIIHSKFGAIFAIEVMTVPFVVFGGIRIGPAVVFSAAAAFGLASDAIVHVIHAWHEACGAGVADPVQVPPT